VTVRAVGLVPHPDRDTAARLVADAIGRLGAHGIEVR